MTEHTTPAEKAPEADADWPGACQHTPEPAASEGEAKWAVDGNNRAWYLGDDGMWYRECNTQVRFSRSTLESSAYAPITDLYAHPPVTAEPAASEGEPQDYDAAIDGNGNLWSFSGSMNRWTGRTSTGEIVSRTADEIKDQTYGFTRLYAHPPVTAEPATAPSVDNLIAKYAAIAEAICDNGTAGDHTWSGLLADFFRAIPVDTAPSFKEQIAEVLRNSAAGIREDAIAQVADYIHVLYSHREDAGTSAAEVQRLTSALAAANHNYANMRDGRLNETLVANQHLRAALEAADARDRARKAQEHAGSAFEDARSAFTNASEDLRVAEARYAAARAAVEADTTEEA